MSADVDPRAGDTPGDSPAPDLTEGQVALALDAVRRELGDLNVELHHSTPFSAVRRHLRALTDQLRLVLAEGTVTWDTAPAVAEVLHARACHIHEQVRHCHNTRFADELHLQEESLEAVVEKLRRYLEERAA